MDELSLSLLSLSSCSVASDVLQKQERGEIVSGHNQHAYVSQLHDKTQLVSIMYQNVIFV